jgi:vitamin B12 transporter
MNVPITSGVNFIGGIDYRTSNTSIETSGVYKYEFGGITYSDSFKTALGEDSAKHNQTAFYGAFIYRSKEDFNLEVGGRLNKHSSYGNNFVFNFNPSYIISNQLKIFANISSAYKVPTLYQLYSEYRNTISDLQPEKAITYEAGIHYYNRNNIFNARIAVFKRNVREGIAFYTDPVSFRSYYINQDKQKDYGFEVEPAINISTKLQAILSLSYVDGKITTMDGAKDTSYFNLIRRPKHIFAISINYQVTNQLFISGSIRNFGKRTDLDFSSFPSKDVELAGYTLLGVYIEYKFKKHFKIFVNGSNLGNVTYYEASGYNALVRNFNTGLLLKL